MQNNKDEKLFYRFRSTSALLDKFHELENGEIYFSPTRDLNDPLEEYMDLSFDGDEILWTNFFQNYLFCLFIFRTIVILTGNAKELTDDDIHAYFDPERKTFLSIEGHNYKMACDKIFANSVIQKVINYFSNREKVISEDELLLFLQYLHFYFLDIFAEIDAEKGLMKQPSGDYLRLSETQLKNLDTIIDGISEDESTYLRLKALHKLTNTIADGYKYLRQLVSVDNPSVTMKNFQLLIDYPKYYIKKLGEIMYPEPYITCFSDNYKDLSMWGYYADSSKGTCLIYKPNVENDNYFIPLKMPYRGTQDFTNMQLKPVSYKAQKPLTPFFRSLGRLNFPMLEKHWYTLNGKKSELAKDLFDDKEADKWRYHYWEHMENSTNIKHPCWQHEQEYRIALIPIFDDDYDTIEKRKIKYNFQNLYGLIFGVNTSESDKLKIIKIIHKKCIKYKRKDFMLYQAVYDNTKGEIDIMPINVLKCMEDFNEQKILK